jgi:multidrug efflux system outer membrane protein
LGTRTRLTGAAVVQTPGAPLIQNSNRLALSTSFELDFWGKLRRATESARAQALATWYARDVTGLTLAGTVAQTYFALRSLDAQIAVTSATLGTQDESLEVTRRRAEAGLASDLDVSQAASVRADVAVQLREFRRQRLVVEHTLGTLVDDLNLKIDPATAPDLMSMPIPPAPPPGLPSSLLDRRPDVRQAEENLVSANALIGVARAAQLPTFSLTGYFGGQSEALSNVLSSGAKIWLVGLDATMPLFDAGKYSARTRQAEARQHQAAGTYQKTIETAFKEVADALTNIEQSAAAEAEVQAKVDASRNSLRLAGLRYKAGYSAYLDVLDAQRTANAAEQQLVQNRQARLSYSVDLMRALGGGWSAQ